MKPQSFEEYQAEKRAREQAAEPHTSRADEHRKAEIKERGLEALRFIYSNQTWERWIDIGEAMLVITEEACAALGAAAWDKDNKPLVRLFNRKWDEYEQRAHNDPAHRPLSKQERSRLRFVMDHTEVGAWRATLPGPQRRKYNHPNAVVEAWKRAQPKPPREPRETRQPSAAQSPALAAAHKENEALKAQVQELEAARETGRGGADVARLEAENAKLMREIAALKARIAAQEAAAKRSRFSGRGYIMPEKQFADLRGCMHPDVIAFLEAVAKDNPALQPKVESLTKQFAKAAMTLTEFKDVLVNKAAEEKGKKSDAFWAAAHWKRDEELQKKARAKQEARSAAAKQRAAAKRATAQAQGGDK